MGGIRLKLFTNEQYCRIFELCNSKSKDKTWDDIAKQLNTEFGGLEVSSSCYRKCYQYYMLMNNALKAKGDTAVATRILSVSDTHVPFELPIETLSAYKGRVDILQLNGDICDCQAISKFNKVYRVSPMEEIIKARKYVIDMIEYLQPKKVVVTYGNHDLRFQNYIAKNLDNEMAELMPRTSLELIFVDGFFHYDKREGTKSWYTPIKELFPTIEIDYTDNWWAQIGDTIFAHPSAFSSGVLKTAERAMYFFRNEGMQFLELVMAHTHRVGEYYIGNTRIIEQGAFSDVSKNNYNNGQLYNSQKEGFVYLCQDINGKTIREKTELVALN
jgi:predicted phosphodiesterase